MADDTLVVTGQTFQQVQSDNLLVTPTGGSQQRLADVLATATGGAGSFTTLTASSTVTLSPASHNVAISPTGTGTVTINPATASAIDNASIGVTTPLAGKFTTLTATGAVSLSPASANVVLSPTGTGVVTVNPATAGTLDNLAIGGTTALAGKFTTLAASTSATIAADNGLKLTSQTSDSGAATATMTNGPTAGNPLFWLRITVNGTNVAVPAWTAV